MSSLEKKNNIYERKRLLDKVVKYFFLFLALLCASFVIFIAVFIAYKGIYPFFHNYSLVEGNYIHQDVGQFFTNSRWLYDGMGGMPFLLLTTLYTTLLSLVISVPTSIFTSLLLVRIVPKFLKSVLQSAVDLLASIPSVIYGLFGAGVICPIVASLGIETFGGRSILSGVIVLAMMSIGRRERKLSSFLKIIAAFLSALLPLSSFSFASTDLLNACTLMIMTLMALSDAKRSISVSWAEL